MNFTGFRGLEALRLAPIDVDDMGRNLVATLYMNRASLFQKIGLLQECLRDCNRALQISPRYAKVNVEYDVA
ncbi:putative heat shock protein 70 (HSP70)-interacting protein [Tripterygium wilfordii]|uniref:Putative heat shock protein 70 (HSP70)-interacting protein n=1 Tax=Tripterygium wilfordii TaxID=458696 RepID=A0A7J7C170_TRIWF|nr:putative heat shock protein 70 (HSP70)-interacting protein [Tripterygium wilfordii]